MNRKRIILHLMSLLLLFGCDRHEPANPFAAAWTGNAIWLRDWLKNGGDPNAIDERGESLLYIATGMKGSVAVAKVLLDAGADPNLRTKMGDLPLLSAAACYNLEAVALLLEYGADRCCKSLDGENAYERALHSRPRDPLVMSYLAEEIENRCQESRK